MPAPEFTDSELDIIYEWATAARFTADATLNRFNRKGAHRPQDIRAIEDATRERDRAIAILKRLTVPPAP